MSSASCVLATPHPLLCRHPWRPNGYVIAGAPASGDYPAGARVVVLPDGRDGRKGTVAWAPAAGCPAIAQPRALAVHPAQTGWGGDDTHCAVAGDLGPVLCQLRPEGGGPLAEGRRPDDGRDPCVCTCLEWNASDTRYLAGGFRALPHQSGEVSSPRLPYGVRIYDMRAPAPSGQAPQYSGARAPLPPLVSCCDVKTQDGVTGLCWMESHWLAIAMQSGALVGLDLRNPRLETANFPAARSDKRTVCLLAKQPSTSHILAAAAVAPNFSTESSVLQLWDTRKATTGPVTQNMVACRILSVAWAPSAFGARADLLTAGVSPDGNGRFDMWDSSSLLRNLARHDAEQSSIGYETAPCSDTDGASRSSRSSRAKKRGTAGSENWVSSGEGPGGSAGKGAGARKALSVRLSLVAAQLVCDDRRVGHKLCGAAWCSPAAAEKAHGATACAVVLSPSGELGVYAPRRYPRVALTPQDGAVRAQRPTEPPACWEPTAAPIVEEYRHRVLQQSGVKPAQGHDLWTRVPVQYRDAKQARELYRSDVSWAMRLREADGFGTFRATNWQVACSFDDQVLGRWAWWTWLMRRVQENFPKDKRHLVSVCPGVQHLLSEDICPYLSLELLKRTPAEEREERRLGGLAEAPAEEAKEGAKDAAKETPARPQNRSSHQSLERKFQVYHLPTPPAAAAGGGAGAAGAPPQPASATVGARQLLLALAGWEPAPDLPEKVVCPRPAITEGAVNALTFEREVARRVFQLRLTEAEDMLRSPDDNGFVPDPGPASEQRAEARRTQYGALAFAFSNLTSDGTRGWRDMTAAISGIGLYLEKSLIFLTCCDKPAPGADDWERYYCVLGCNRIDLMDRVAFACRYLDDVGLRKCLGLLIREVRAPVQAKWLGGIKEQAMLNLLLSGLAPPLPPLLPKEDEACTDTMGTRATRGSAPPRSPTAAAPTTTVLGDLEGRDLASLLYFVDVTADVQVAALTVGLLAPSKATQPPASHWIKEYHEFLHRSVSDVARCRAEMAMPGQQRQQTAQATPKPQQAYPAQHPALAFGRPRSKQLSREIGATFATHRAPAPAAADGGGTAAKAAHGAKVNSMLQLICPCGKPLVSLQHPTAGFVACKHCKLPAPKCVVCQQIIGLEQDGAPSSHLSWCVTCQHGGHLNCLVPWFDRHDACPCPGCACSCITLDD